MSVGYPLKFGKYLLLERVNVGGMAEVFKAKTFGVAGFERILAIKRILPSLVEDEEFIRMFIDEARIAVQLNHANIVQIYELGKHGEHYYIAMEYLPSRDARTILDKMRANGQLMPIPQAAYIISKVCEGLDYAHRRRDPAGNPMNIVHRDVSPQNILVSYEGEIKIIDFGIAKAANRASKTQAGVLKGKFGYMSPEQVRGLPIDRRSDIFAVGVLLYEMLTGERLFVGESDFSTLERVRNAEVPPPTTFNKKITPELEQIVLKALAREVDDRYQWASELAEDLQRFLIEERSIYSAKRLAAYMKESYSDIIGAERKKMEDFLSMSDDMAHSEPSFEPATDDGPIDIGMPGDGIDYGEVEEEVDTGFEEDKTFVIEASEAGKHLVPTDANGEDPSSRPPRVPNDPTNDDFLNEASLYGGSDDDDYVDDAKTEVSFTNPFDEQGDDDGGTFPGQSPPSAAATEMPSAEAATAIRTDGVRSASQLPDPGPPPASAEGGPPPAVGGATQPHSAAPPPGGFDPVAAAMAEDAGGYNDPGSLPAGPPLGAPAPAEGTAPGVGPSGDQTAPGALDDVAGRQLPAGALPSGEVQAPQAEESKRVPTGCLIGLIATVAVGFLSFIGAAVALVIVLTGDEPASIRVVAEADQVPPGPVEVLVDGAVVASALPATIDVGDAPAVVVAIRGQGITPFEMEVPGLRPGQSRIVQVPLGLKEGKDPAGGEGDQPAGAADTKPDDEAGDDAAKERGEEQVAAKDGAPEGAEPAEAGEGQAAASAATEQAASGDRWRLSFTAVHPEEHRSIRGAEVLMGDRVVGTTPFEVELDGGMDSVTVQVRAQGFVSREVEFLRNGQDRVGPTSVALHVDGAQEGVAGEGSGAQGASAEGEAPEGEGGDDEKAAAAEAEDGETEVAAAEDDEGDGRDEGGADDEAEAASAEKKEPTRVASRKRAEPNKRARRSHKRSTKRRSSSGRKAQKAEKRDAAPAKATLAVGTRPRAKVYVDRRARGMTPLMHKKAVSLSPGRHWMVLENETTKESVKLRLDLKGGESVLIFDFNSGKIVRKKGPVKAKVMR